MRTLKEVLADIDKARAECRSIDADPLEDLMSPRIFLEKALEAQRKKRARDVFYAIFSSPWMLP